MTVGKTGPGRSSLTAGPTANLSFTSWCLPSSPGMGDEAGHPCLVLSPYLIVHDGSETKDADVDVILLAHQARVLQRPAPRESAIPGGEGLLVKGLEALAITQTAAAEEKGDGGPCTSSPERCRGRRCRGQGTPLFSPPWNRSLSVNYPGSQHYNQCPNHPKPRRPPKYNTRCVGLPRPQDGSRRHSFEPSFLFLLVTASSTHSLGQGHLSSHPTSMS